ncbi:hypothetical protein ISS08_00775 [Candidatus Pacearchaeota archaeon]|nr:hypothetical protein [Candidatus Pacearchaeota archaeon]
MDKTQTLKLFSVMSLLIILFTPLDSQIWKLFLSLGIVLGLAWFVRI